MTFINLNSFILSLFLLAGIANGKEYVLELSWPKVDGAKFYHLKITDRKKNIIFEDQTTKLNYLWRINKKGSYYFQYAYTDEEGSLSEFSNRSKLLLQKKYNVNYEVKIEKPSKKEIFKIKAGKDTLRVNFKWEKIESSTHYFIGIYNKKKKLILKNKTDLNYFHTFLAEGKYYWKVIAVYPENEKTKSKLHSFTLKNPYSYKKTAAKKELKEKIFKENLDYYLLVSAYGGFSSLAISFEYEDSFSFTDINISQVNSYGINMEYRRGSTLLQLGLDQAEKANTYTQAGQYLNILPLQINFDKGRINLGAGTNFGSVSFVVNDDDLDDLDEEDGSEITTSYNVVYLSGNLEYLINRNFIFASNLGVGALFDSSKFSLNYSWRNKFRHFWSNKAKWYLEYGFGIINHTIRNQSVYLFTNRYEASLGLGRNF
ncbi:hypothetical protein N9N67_05715 [Bacteriovoracaceae bacterium]|nr:hypothetical protein [Bacteriovoracaceae bacterium]